MATPFEAAPAPTSVPMAQRYPTSLRVVSNEGIDQMEAGQQALEQQAVASTEKFTPLLGFIRNEWDIMRRHRDTVVGWTERLLGRCAPSMASTIRRN